jgi:hypothetical protein
MIVKMLLSVGNQVTNIVEVDTTSVRAARQLGRIIIDRATKEDTGAEPIRATFFADEPREVGHGEANEF